MLGEFHFSFPVAQFHFQCAAFCSAALTFSLILKAVKPSAVEANPSRRWQGRKEKFEHDWLSQRWSLTFSVGEEQFGLCSGMEGLSPAGPADQQTTHNISPGFLGHKS